MKRLKGISIYIACCIALGLLLGSLFSLVTSGGAAAIPAADTLGMEAPSPTPVPTASPSPSPAAEAESEGEAAEPGEGEPAEPPEAEKSAGEPYTIAWLSDTQYYSASYPETFYAMTRYLRNRQGQLNLQYIVHTGDLVNKYNNETQWERANRAMRKIENIPHGVLAGNHDVNGNAKDYTLYSKYFGERKYKKKSYYGGSYENNQAHYDLMELGKTEYIFVYLGYAPDAKEIAFANEAFQAYPKRVGILCVHDYLDSDAGLRPAGRTLQKEVVAANPNVYMVLCGHRYTEDCIPVKFDDDGDGKYERTVYQCIANYQNIDNKGGSGFIRLIEVDETNQELRFRTYSPLLKETREAPARANNGKATWPIPWM